VVAEREAMGGFTVHDVLGKPLDAERLVGSLALAGVSPERGRIFVVDDDPKARTLMETTLHQLGFRATGFAEGAPALDAARSTLPLAVVLDLMMPGMNGFEFLERFRELPDAARVPVLIWTVKDLSVDETRLLQDAAQAVLTKQPRSVGQMVAQLRASLR